jgi:hypothetical protein
MATTDLPRISRRSTAVLFLLAPGYPGCSDDSTQHVAVTTTVTTPEPGTTSGATLPTDPSANSADACPTDTIFAFPNSSDPCPTPVGENKKIIRRVSVLSGKEMQDLPKVEGIEAMVCRYVVPTVRDDATFLSDAKTILGTDAFQLDCPVFRVQGWTPSSDQRRMRALRQMHRIAAGAAFPGSNFPTAPKVLIHVLDSVATTHKNADAADLASLLGIESMEFPSSAHGLSVASVIVDIACGDSPDCRGKLDLRHQQVLKYNAGYEAWGYHKDLAEGIGIALAPEANPDAKPALINLSVADPAQKPLLALTGAFASALANHSKDKEIQGDLDGFKKALGPARFAVFATLAMAWCRGVPVFAAAGNLPAAAGVPDSTIEAAFPAVLGTLSLRRPTSSPSNSSTVLCKLIDPKGKIAYGPPVTVDPLVWAVGAASHNDTPLAASRGKREVKLYAHGLAVAAENERTGFEVMTGTSGATATVTAIVARALALSPLHDGNAIVRTTLLAGDPPIGDLCWTLRSVCKALGTPACLPYTNGAITCAPRTDVQRALAKWGTALGEYVAAVSRADRTVVIGGLEVEPQPGGQHCPAKFCGVFKNTFIGRFDEHLNYGSMVSLSLRGANGDVKYETPLSGGASAGGSVTNEIGATFSDITWADVAYAVVAIDDDQNPSTVPSYSEVPVHH